MRIIDKQQLFHDVLLKTLAYAILLSLEFTKISTHFHTKIIHCVIIKILLFLFFLSRL